MIRSALTNAMIRYKKTTIKIPVLQLQVFVLVLLPFCAFATVADFNDQFKDFTAGTVIALAGLILCGTVSGMLHRLKNEYKVNGTVRHPLLFVSSDIVGGALAGWLMVLVGFGNGFPSWLVAATTGLAAFAGSMLIEQGWQSLANRYLPENPESPIAKVVEKVTTVKPKTGDARPPQEGENE